VTINRYWLQDVHRLPYPSFYLPADQFSVFCQDGRIRARRVNSSQETLLKSEDRLKFTRERFCNNFEDDQNLRYKAIPTHLLPVEANIPSSLPWNERSRLVEMAIKREMGKMLRDRPEQFLDPLWADTLAAIHELDRAQSFQGLVPLVGALYIHIELYKQDAEALSIIVLVRAGYFNQLF
jgi:hypothetical protein